MRRGSIWASVFLRLNQQGGQSLRAGRREGRAVPGAGGHRARYLMALTGGFRRRISARLFRSRVYSAMSPRSRRSSPLPRAGRCRFPPRAGPTRRGGAPADQCEPGAAFHRPQPPEAPGSAAVPPTRFSSSPPQPPRSAGACALFAWVPITT